MKRKQEEECKKVKKSMYGDGGSWVRGSMLGKGSFASVFMAIQRKPGSRFCCFPPVMAVKSAEVSVSGTLQKEKEALFNVQGCPNVVKCFGEEITLGGSGEMVYNLLLEYASGGTLASLIKNSNLNPASSSSSTILPESDVKRYTRSILRGLNHIHERGYVHCDLKPENVLLVPSSSSSLMKYFAKIADFGLAKRLTTQSRKKIAYFGLAKRGMTQSKKKRRLDTPRYFRGSVEYMSPEAVTEGEQEPPSDIWALGCVVLEMLTGKPPWDQNINRRKDDDDELNGKRSLLSVIGSGRELPEIPSCLSEDAKGFLKGCFVRKTMYRFTAEMLLNHPFVAALDDQGNGDDHEEEEEEEEGWHTEKEIRDVERLSSVMSWSSDMNDDDDFGSSFESFYLESDFPLPETEVVVDDEKKAKVTKFFTTQKGDHLLRSSRTVNV